MKSRKMVTITATWLAAVFLLTIGFAIIPLQSSAAVGAVSQGVALPLKDIKGHWAEAGIMNMYAREVMTGYGDGSFGPKKPVTYLDGIVMLDKMLWGKPPKGDLENSEYLQKDFNIPAWAVGFISSALRHQIIYYNDLQKVALTQPMTRQDIAVLAVRALELSGDFDSANKIKLSFTDANEIPDQFKGYIALINELGIMTGFPDGSFKPNGTVSRAEIAWVLDNIAGYIPYLKKNEVTGFVKSVDISEGIITLSTSNGNESRVELPGRYFTYLDNKSVNIDEITPGLYLRVLTSIPRNTTVILAQNISPEGETPVVFEQVLAVASSRMQKWVEQNKIKESFVVRSDEEKIYLLAARGEKMTGGYKVDIRKVSLTKNKDGGLDYKVLVFRSDPGPDRIVNQVISYPYSLVRFENPKEAVSSITFVDELHRVLAVVKL